MPYVELNDFNMYYEEKGTGETIIFIHGSLSKGEETFSKQISFFSRYYRCICIDLRGHGKSGYPEFDWNTKSLADDIIIMMRKLNVETAHLVGHSMGGDVAMYCGIKCPEKVRTIVSICSAGMVNDNITSYLEQLSPEKIDKTKFGKFLDKMQNDYGELWQDTIKHTIWNCSNFPDFSKEQLCTISTPFLLIRGDTDNMVLDKEVELLKKCIPDFRYFLIENGNHFLHSNSQTSDTINKMILDFIT